MKFAALIKEHLPADKFVIASQRDIDEIRQAFEGTNVELKADGTGFTFTKEMIQGAEFQVEVKSGSTLPVDRRGRVESITAILKLGPTIGIIPQGPGLKVALTLGKNLIGEFDMKEVELAYDAMLKEIDIQEQVARKGQRLAVESQAEQIEELKEGGVDGV